jgi:moderate conductance mechanosensitive channel
MRFDLPAVAQTGIVSLDWLKENGVRIALIVLLAFAVSRAGTLAIRRMRRHLDGAARLTGALNLRRTATIVGIVTSVFRIVTWTIVGLLVLGQFGVDLGPLIAGAGIVGVALGFGAQSLVRDFLAGFFILLENQFTVGDAVELTTDVSAVKVSGRVEALTLRATCVRAEDGSLNVIPNGNLHIVQNRSRGQARVVVEVHIPRGENLEEIRRILGTLCAEIRTDERLAGRLFSGPDVLGLDQLDEDTLLLRIAAETTPARADEIREEIGKRIERRFAPVPLNVGVE